ncbi:ABC transporter [Mycolicibacter minnesotensis]|uniref:ABC transporter n=2 Tax=Mycolicibacter minnesotensis TaxID=1118379 RepID=A0A7I7R6X8_9MYCO|nr:ABC transporter [Mycolicibacter minnesotensis]BBY34371.1 ABC transporter ATP-binding protein [Mycolicibacter minnesotensis]
MKSASALRSLLPYLRPYRARWITMVTVAVLSLGVTVVIPLMTKAVIDGPVAHRDQPGLWVLGMAATALGVVEAVLWFVRRWLIAHGTMGVEADIRKDLYARLQLLPMTFHGRWQSGQLLSRIMNDLAAVRRFLSFVAVFLVLNALQIITVSTILVVLYWPLGVVVCLSLVPVMLAVQHFQRQYTLLSRRAQDQAGQVATQVEESAAGLRTVKAFGREDHVFARFDHQAKTLHDLGVDKVVVSSKFWTLLEVIPNFTLILVVAGGAYAAGHHLVTLGTLVAFVTLMLSLIWPLSALGFLLSATQEAMTAADRITEIFHAPVEITDGEDPSPPSGRLELRDVGFRFATAGVDAPWVLRGVNLTIEAGETVALVGATGSGKSVLAMLLSRLYDVSAGQIMIGGRDIRSLTLPALRSAVITAFDDPTLFSMSVAENLRLGRPDADDMDLARALDVASANFVYELPEGLETRIGEQGMSLSGGQRQRLSLARALVAAPTILVLDDTLSALDVHTEAAVTAALRRVLRDAAAPITALVVANRASTVALADRVALIEDGTITAVGTHAELLAGVPRYRNLLAADDELDDGAEHLVEWVRR